MKSRLLCVLILLSFCAAVEAAEPDVLIADFEGPDYDNWKATGAAFGPGPARGTLPGQMDVSGFEGKGLVNSFHNGDGTTGTLTSPEFTIQRDYVNFLIGGGWHPGETCINLLVDGKVARTATGPNKKPGGTERLDPTCWDVKDLKGKTARIEIVDKARGGWGHVNIDHIVQSSRRAGPVSSTKEIRIDKDYVRFCIAAGQGPRATVSLRIDDAVVRNSSGTGSDKDAWISWDVSQLKGKTGQLTIEEMPAADGTCPIHDSLTQSDEPKGAVLVVDRLYHETYRPQFHFSPRKNWTNDPNGLVYYDGEYHLFFQHNPFGINWGNMTWGHAVSPDLVRWKQLDHAIHPDKLGTIFSGSAVVDWENTAGFQAGDEKVIVCIYTSAGNPFTQSIAYSNDRGRTWTKYEKNPVLGHIVGSNRDPKVIWHEPIKKWVMALFLDGGDYALFTSPDLKQWERLCDIPPLGAGECPDFFELPIDGDPDNTRWIFWGGNGNYLIGRFDGEKFASEGGPFRFEHGQNYYAAQTYSDVPKEDGRRIQIGWMRGGKYPGMPFNQQMSFPRVLTLRGTPDGPRLYCEPVEEIATIRGKEHTFREVTLKPGENLLEDLCGDLFEIRLEIEPGKAETFGFDVRGAKVEYAVAPKRLTSLGRSVELAPQQGRIALQILVDRTCVETFGGGGKVSISSCFLPSPADQSLGIFATGGEAKIVALTVYELRSAWP